MRVIIREAFEKIKAALLSLPRELFLGLVILLVGTASFGLGRLSGQEVARTPVRILYPSAEEGRGVASGAGSQTASVAAAVALTRPVVASSKGTKYHYPWCPGAKSISEKNKITYESAAAAEKAGYTIAANCK